MPVARRTLNAFTAKEVHEITGLSRPMIDYLLRMDFLRPFYADASGGTRGKVRYYSYRDLVVARLIQRLRDTGVELHKLKSAVHQLCSDEPWQDLSADKRQRLNWLISDGHEVLLKSRDGFLDTFRKDGQRAFTFVVNLPNLETEVRKLVPLKKRKHCSMQNSALKFEASGRKPRVARRPN